MMATKRARSANFSPEEKEILVDLIHKYRVIENKKTDGSSVAEKAKAWASLTTEFNSMSSFSFRSEHNLKSLWDNLKRATRSAVSAEKKETFRTGGGGSGGRNLSHIHSKILALIGPTGEGLENIYDCDRDFHVQNDTEQDNGNNIPSLPECSVIPTEIDDNVQVTEIEIQDRISDWSTWSPNLLRSAVSVPLVFEADNPDPQPGAVLCDVNTATGDLQQPSTSSGAVSKTPRLSRRRPYLAENHTKELLEKKMKLVETLKKNAEDEAKINLLILNEKLKQERIKTEILELELKEKQKP